MKAAAEMERQTDMKPKKKSGIKLIIFIIMVLVLIVGGYFVWQFYFQGKERPQETITTAPLEFTVNLADSMQNRYLKATVRLGYTNKKLIKEIEAKVPELRDVMIEIFRSKKVSEIETKDGTDSLKTELKEALNEKLKSDEISDIYFTDFIIQ